MVDFNFLKQRIVGIVIIAAFILTFGIDPLMAQNLSTGVAQAPPLFDELKLHSEPPTANAAFLPQARNLDYFGN